MRPAVIAAGVCAALVCAGPASAWRFDLHGSVTDGSIINNVASSVAVDPAGDVVVAGCLEEVPVSLDFTVVKLSGGRGREVWRRQIRGTHATGGNCANAVAVDRAGDVVAVGHLENAETPGAFVVVKLAGADGTVLWQRQLSGTGGWGIGFALTLNDDGDVLATGTVLNDGTGDDFTVVKIDGTTGDVVWQTDLDDGGNDIGHAIALDADGDVVAAGGGFEGFAVVALSGSDGSERWRRVVSGHGAALAIGVSPHGIVAGGNLDDRGLVIGLDAASGAEQWRYEVTADVEAYVRALAVDPRGDVVAAGYRNPSHDSSAEVVKLDARTGVERWRFSEPSATATALALDARGDALVAGSSLGQFFVSKLRADGTEAWRRLVRSRVGGSAAAVVADADGNAIAAGATQTVSTNVSDLTAVALDADTGRDKACGDGVVDAGEACDDGNEEDGDGCSASCRREGCAGEIELEDVRIVLAAGRGRHDDGRLLVRGTMTLPAATPLDPATMGMQLVLTDLGTGRPLLDLSEATNPVPPGGPGEGCDPYRDGWRTAGETLFAYRNASGAIDPPRCTADSAQGLRRLTLLDLRRSAGIVRFALRVQPRSSRLVGPLALRLILARDGSTPCGETAVAVDCPGGSRHCRARHGRPGS